MKRFLAALGFGVVALGLFALTDTASATNGVLDDFISAYPATAGTSLDSCSTCHTSIPALNAYGSAVKASGMNFPGIEGLDSDGDGVGNLQEIRSLTNPGIAADRPATTTTTTSTTSATSTTSTTSTTAAASPQSVATTPAPAPNVAVAPAGAIAFDAGVAGKVWLSVGAGVLIVERVDTTWDFKIEMDDDGEIEIKFRQGGQEIEFEAELEDGTIKTELEIEFDDHGDHDDDDHDSDDDGHGDEDDDGRDDDYVGRDHDDDHESDDDD